MSRFIKRTLTWGLIIAFLWYASEHPANTETIVSGIGRLLAQGVEGAGNALASALS